MALHSKKISLTALLLVALMLVSTACAESVDDAADTSSQTEAQEVAAEDTEEPDIRVTLKDNVPESDFGEYTFTMYSRDRDDFVNDLGLIYEEETGDIVKDTIIKRNRNVEERFNINLEAVYNSEPTSAARKLITADDDSCALVLDNALNTGAAITDGNYMAWDDLPYIDLTKPWYNRNVVDAMSVNGHTYMMAGEFNLSVLRFTYCMYYNKGLAEAYNISDIYDRVMNHEWTYDLLYSTVENVYQDLNGNGSRDEEDMYGLSTDFYGASTNFSYALGVKLTAKDADGIPQNVYYSEKTVDVFNRIYDLLFNNSGVLAGTWGIEAGPWKSEHALFVNNFFQSSSDYRDLEFDYGVLPYPMYDENQDNYYSHSNVAFTVCAIPTTTSELERTCAIVEGLQSESWRIVIPAYYETALKVKYSRDDAAAQVLDMILDARYLDFGIIYDQNKGCATIMQKLFSEHKDSFASTYEKQAKSIERHYSKLIEKLCELD